MTFKICFKKEESYPSCNVHVSDKKLHALQSLICSDIQFLNESSECFLLKWLQNDHLEKDFTSGNTCMIVISGNEVSVEGMFFDTPSLLYLEKDELISLINLWIQFCNNGTEVRINLKSLHFAS